MIHHTDQACQESVDLTPYVLDQLFEALRVQLQTDGGPSEFHIWQSIIIVEPSLGDKTATWLPEGSLVSFNHARYHILPYFASYHWQLAVFDQFQGVIARYDSAWVDGTDRSTFSVL